MLSREVTDLLSIKYQGLFDDQEHCFMLLAAKRDSGDADTPAELTNGPLFDLSPDLFIWVAQKHLENDSGHLVARDVMSNISAAGLSGCYGKIVDMLAEAGHRERAAQIWRADVASHMDVFREYLRARKAVSRYDDLPEASRKGSAPNRFQRQMAEAYSKKRTLALEALDGFERWASHYGIAERHIEQIGSWREEIEGEAMRKLPPPEKTPMSTELFWQIIAEAQSSSESETILRIEDRVAKLSAKAIRDAAKTVQLHLQDAYRQDVWALAYLLQGGCSDDAFEEFRNWMILQGHAVFQDILTDPDAFDPARISGADFGAAGGLMSAFENAYLARSGKPLILPRGKGNRIKLDEQSFADLLPNLSSKLAAHA